MVHFHWLVAGTDLVTRWLCAVCNGSLLASWIDDAQSSPERINLESGRSSKHDCPHAKEPHQSLCWRAAGGFSAACSVLPVDRLVGRLRVGADWLPVLLHYLSDASGCHDAQSIARSADLAPELRILHQGERHRDGVSE